MTGLEHTLVAVICIAISFYVGQRFGVGSGYSNGYYDGMTDSITALMKSISEEYDLSLKADVSVQSVEE